MRIISGKFKGKKLFDPIDKKTRPLKDLTKESIFNLIIHSNSINVNLEKCNILDLFSGSGSFGLECFSRGVKKVTFIENYLPAIKILKKNINLLKLDTNVNLIEKNIFDFNTYKKIEEKFDIIFLDPPYKENKIVNLFSIIFDLNLLKKNGVVIVHRNKKSNDNGFGNFKIIDKRIYGVSKIIFLKSN